MTGRECIFIVSDNSGLVYARCIGLPRGFKKYVFNLGQFIRMIPKIINFSNGKIKRKRLYKGIIIGLKKVTRRRGGRWIKFRHNRVLLLDERFKFQGTRVDGPICKEMRCQVGTYPTFKRVVSYSGGTI
jgi:ribosomal protein L14